VLGEAIFELGEIGYSVSVEFGVEAGGGATDGAGFGWEVGVRPGAEAAVEDVDVLGAEGAEHPPGARGGEDTLLLVDDDGAGVGGTESGHAAGEGLGCGEHVGERGGVVGEVFDAEEDGAGDVGSEVAGMGVDGWRDAYGWESGVEDDCVGVLEAGGQPCGRDERGHGD